MRYRRYMIETLRTSGREVPTQGGDLVVATKDESSDVDWELIYRSSKRWPIKQDPYDLAMEGPGGKFSGPAILVRSDGLTHVFRGVGLLDGFDHSQLQGPGEDQN